MPQTLFTTRAGGVSAAPFDSFNLALHVGDDPDSVRSNRGTLANRIGTEAEKVFFMNQVHGNSVAIIDENSNSSLEPTADALFTSTPGIALVVLVADCTPLLLKSTNAIAAVHVGRRGLVAGVMEATLKFFESAGIRRDEISAELGPSICADCYEVDLKTYEEVIEKNPDAATSIEKHSLNIAGGLRANLAREGIAFEYSRECVKHDPGYFSYRNASRTGRQAGVIWI
jgi:YfiH family protein